MTRELTVKIPPPNAKQREFLKDRPERHIGYGGARGGGKSWAVRVHAVRTALRYPGAKILIIRRTYPELINNHIRPLKTFFAEQRLSPEFVRYNDKDKRFGFSNGSAINFAYCAKDDDLDRLQGTEWDEIYLDEATQLSEFQIKAVSACLRGTNDIPRHMFYTCNPGGQSHQFFRRIFIDREFRDDEKPEDYAFIQALVTDNTALMAAQPEYVEQLRALPPHLRKMWLEGCWDIFSGQFFEDFRPTPDAAKAAGLGMTPEELRRAHRWCHVIEPFDPKGMTLYRSYDFGYNKPFSCAWWAVDQDDVIYRILEYYGCTETPNEGVKMTPDEQFQRIREIEQNHPYLRGRRITGVADPAIWKAETGISVAETAAKYGVFFEPADNQRLAGWMQCHYRLAFDENGYAMMYVFDTCKAFVRTIPTLMYDEHRPEDLDTSMEDHVADEWRYLCMARPIKPRTPETKALPAFDPLDRWNGADNRYASITTGGR